MLNISNESSEELHETRVNNALIKEIQSASRHINETQHELVWFERYDTTVVITVSESAAVTPKPMTYARNKDGLEQAKSYIHSFVTVSPSTSAKEGNLQEARA